MKTLFKWTVFNKGSFLSLFQERENPKILSHKRETLNVDFDSADCFMDKKVVFGHVFDMETGILQ